jgi:hypothetical protein
VTCRQHRFFMRDFRSNVDQVTAMVGKNWTVRCDHCGMNIAGQADIETGPHHESSILPMLPVIVHWKLTPGTWFGEFTVEDPDHGKAT